MYDIVFPRHFSYRVIAAKVSNVGVFHHLSVHRSLALNVRRLEILDERSPDSSKRIPRDAMLHGRDTDLESSDDEVNLRNDKLTKVLLTAISRMARLETFTWSCNHSLVLLQSIWPTLLKCSSLKSVDINDNLIFGPLDPSSESIVYSDQMDKEQIPLVSSSPKVTRKHTKSHVAPEHYDSCDPINQ